MVVKKFVYSLVDNGQVFYIGCTKDIHKRYRQHIMKSNKTLSGVYISAMIERGVFPEINILSYLPECEAHFEEAKIINTFSHAGQPLINSQYFRRPHKSIEIKSGFTAKDVLKIVKYKQKVYMFNYANRDEDGKQISYEYPEEPKFRIA